MITGRNAVRCKKCGDIIESVHRHDFVWCKCRNVAVDGGKEYRRRVFSGDESTWEEMFDRPNDLWEGWEKDEPPEADCYE